MGSRFVRPDTTVIKISNGDTLTVKRRLSAEDSRQLRAMQTHQTLAEAGLVLAYLVDWTLVDAEGKKEPILGASMHVLGNLVKNLDEDDFDEIHAAIKAHREAMKDEREQEKNAQAGEMNGSAISLLPSEQAGQLSGSVN